MMVQCTLCDGVQTAGQSAVCFAVTALFGSTDPKLVCEQ